MSKNLKDIFNTISEDVLGEFKNSVIEKVVTNRNRTKIKIYLLMDRIESETYLPKIEENIKNSFIGLEKVIIDVRYDVDYSKKEKLGIFWSNLIYIISRNSQIDSAILKKSTFTLDDDIITIKVDRNSKYVLEKNNSASKIVSILKSKIDEDYKVELLEVKRDNNINVTEDFVIEKTYKPPTIHAKDEIDIKDDIQTKITKTKPSPQVSAEKPKFEPRKKKFSPRDSIVIDDTLDEEAINIKDNIFQDMDIVVQGEIIDIDKREIRSGKYLVTIDIADKSDAVTVKFFVGIDTYNEQFKPILEDDDKVAIKVKGTVRFDSYSNELNILANVIKKVDIEEKFKTDDEEVKRVELHLHTSMSSMDAVNHVSDYINTAKKLGHKAIAVTDHGVVQAFPDALKSSGKAGVKILYGVEAYLVNDTETVVFDLDTSLLIDDATYVVFDLETTGLKSRTCKIIEIGAVKIKNGEIIDEFSAFVNPKESLSEEIVKITKIDDKMLINAPTIDTVISDFLEFIEDSVLVAHNASFDIGFLNKNVLEIKDIELNNAFMDTVGLSRMLLPDLHNHKLDTVAKNYKVELNNHHRAIYDAKCTAEVFLLQLKDLKELNIFDLNEINEKAVSMLNHKFIRPNHAIIFVKEQKGLKNLYELISHSHIDYYLRNPRIPKSLLNEKREGLIVGSACEAGEVYKAFISNMPTKYIDNICSFYDYLEIQPIGNNMYLHRENYVNTVEELCRINYDIIMEGKKLNKLTVATGDVHFLNPEDEIYRRVLMDSKGFNDADNQPPLYYRTTKEMLDEFSYLSDELKYEVVVTNPNIIADSIEDILPIPKETSAPNMPTADKDIVDISYSKANEIYGDPLPATVKERIDRELDLIIRKGFAGLYIIAQKLVWNSLENGYLVGSRGSVGSSLVATMLQITEVNPLSPHYICPNCKYSEFDSDVCIEFRGLSGADMPDKDCPNCNTKLLKDGHDIPFETFLGFDGDKEPDIDLNFSSEYQAKAHAYTEELFGKGYIFKAGTIGTLADKTAQAYVFKYLEKRDINIRRAGQKKLAKGIVGVKKTSGQHPGGLMVVPDYTDIHYFTPVQRPANDMKSTVTTTHFDYHSISGKLLKLDILGHTAPTIIKMLQESTGVDPLKIDIGDKKIMTLFTSKKELGLKDDDIDCPTGSLGLPEFGTDFVRQMLVDTQPSSFSELARISGLSHGSGVWIGNAYELVKDGTCTLKEVIPTRDDIMVYLIIQGVEKKEAFNIMETVRKGRDLSAEQLSVMRENEVPEWYIESCKKITYMFPKGHAVAYVIMSVRIAYFKIHYPKDFYAATFSISAEEFDYETMCISRGRVKEEMKRINSLGKEATANDKSKFSILELVDEMYARGITFLPIDLYESKANKFVVKEDGILPPLCAIAGLGASVAEAIEIEREIEAFDTIEDLRNRTKANKNVIEIMKNNSIIKGMSETNQLSLFS